MCPCNASWRTGIGSRCPVLTLISPPPPTPTPTQVQDTPGGTYLTYTVPATATTDANYLLLNFSASGPGVPPYSYPYPYPNYYVSLRSRTPTYDNILPNKINDQVWVGAAAAKK